MAVQLRAWQRGQWPNAERFYACSRRKRSIAGLNVWRRMSVSDHKSPAFETRSAIPRSKNDRGPVQRLHNWRAILREAIAGQQAYIVPLAEGHEANSIKLAFKDHSGPLKRSWVRVAAIGSIHSGMGTNAIMTDSKPCTIADATADTVIATGVYLVHPNGEDWSARTGWQRLAANPGAGGPGPAVNLPDNAIADFISQSELPGGLLHKAHFRGGASDTAFPRGT
jgi:hypothetical protein